MMKFILKTTFIAGSLDIIAASIQANLSNGVAPLMVLKYIASGMFGSYALKGGMIYAILGLLIHFIITLMCVWVFFISYQQLRLLRKSIWLNALLIALVAWSVTNLAVIPLSKIKPATLVLDKVITAIGILFFCIGLPIAYSAKKFFSKKLK